MRRTPGRWHALTVLLVSAPLAFGCDTAPAASDAMPPDTVHENPRAAPDTVRDQVLAELEQYYADLSDREWERVRDHFLPGATLTTRWTAPDDSVPSVSVTTIDQFIEQAPLGPGSREIFEERMTRAEVRGNAHMVQVWARYDASFGDTGDVKTWSGTDAFTMIRHDGRWRIASLTYLSDEN